MNRVILSVDFRHAWAYVRVGGKTQNSAERHAKIVGRVLTERLSPKVGIGVPRYKGLDKKANQEVYEIPVGVFADPGPSKVALAELLLRGSV
jgi:hypothetical protein